MYILAKQSIISLAVRYLLVLLDLYYSSKQSFAFSLVRLNTQAILAFLVGQQSKLISNLERILFFYSSKVSLVLSTKGSVSRILLVLLLLLVVATEIGVSSLTTLLFLRAYNSSFLSYQTFASFSSSLCLSLYTLLTVLFFLVISILISLYRA